MGAGTNDFASILRDTFVVYQHLMGDATLSRGGPSRRIVSRCSRK
jgi:hypothetical protein